MMKTKKQQFLLMLLLTLGLSAGAQDLSEIYSPNLFLGTVDVNIPIYEQGGIGARLTYNTKGVPVREMAGPAGLHWNLQAGGAIYRTVKGIPDEKTYESAKAALEGIPAVVSLINYDSYKGRIHAAVESPEEKLNNLVFRDTESDEYIFSAAGKYFKFYIGKSGEIFTDPDAKYDILFERGGSFRKLTDQSVSGAIGAFNIKVIDRQDNSAYYFSPSIKRDFYLGEHFIDWENAVNDNVYDMYLSREYYFNWPSIPIQWKLDSIIQNKQKTALSYKIFSLGATAQDSSWIGVQSSGLWIAEKSPSYNRSGFCFVDTIKYPDGTILSFDYKSGNGDRLDVFPEPYTAPGNLYPKLNEIVVSNANNKLRFKFDYAYFYSDKNNPEVTSSSGLTQRADMYSLKLKSITKSSTDNTEQFLLYRFEYNNKKPRRFAKGLDFYGYFNGIDDELGVVGHSVPGIYNSPVNKNQSAAIANGLLTGIQNGYGGKLEFKYALHGTFTNVASPIAPAGPEVLGSNVNDGVRIDSIVKTDVNNPHMRNVVYFEYSNGQRFVPGGYHKLRKYIMETFISPTLLYMGSNHGYSNVTEYYKNKEGALLGKSEYTFSNFKDGSDPAKTLIVGGGLAQIGEPYADKQYIKDWEIGLLLSEKKYDNKGLIISETHNKYLSKVDTTSSLEDEVSEVKRAVTHLPNYFYEDPDNSGNTIRNFTVAYDPYRPYRGKSLLSKSIKTTYASNVKKMVDSVEYTYDDRDNRVATVYKNSDGETIKQLDYYNYNLHTDVVNASPTLSALKSLDRELLIGTEKWKLGIVASTDKLLNLDVFRYQMLPNDILVSKEVHQYEVETPLTRALYSIGAGSPDAGNPEYKSQPATERIWSDQTIAYLSKAVASQQYDQYGNVTEAFIPATEQYKVNLFDRSSRHKIVEVMNARKNEVAFADFDNDIDGGFVFNNSFVMMAGTYNAYLPDPGLTLQAVSGSKMYVLHPSLSTVYCTGLTASKEYRITFWATDNGTPQIAVPGLVISPLTHIATRGRFKQYEAIFSVNNSGGSCNIYSGSTLALDDIRICPSNAAMQNWIYEPLFGVKSMTGALGLPVYNEYDKLGRVVLTRDHEGNVLSKTEYGAH